MMKRVVFAPVIVFVLTMCTQSEHASKTVSDSTSHVSDDHSTYLPSFTYERAATIEGLFADKLNNVNGDTIRHAGFLSLSETIVLQSRSNLMINGGPYMELKAVMFREHAPIVKLTDCKNITFKNVNFSAQYAYQSLVELSNCRDITFDNCTFQSDQNQAIVQSNSTNIVFNACTFGDLPYSNAEEPTTEEQADGSYNEVETNEYEDLEEGPDTENPIAANVNYPVEAWASPVTALSIPRQQENLNYFGANPFFTAATPDRMNYASYSALEFGRDFFTPIDWTTESETWKEGAEIDGYIPSECDDYQKVLSLTRARRKLWFIHRKLTFEQESGIDGNNRWRDDQWLQNRSYYHYLFTNRSSTFIEQVWLIAQPYLSDHVAITKQEFGDALIFVDELLLYYSKVKATPFWEDRFYFLGNMDVNLSSGDYFDQAGFPLHSNNCMRSGYTGGNYITGYDWGNEAWMYGFWLRRHKEGNMETVKEILIWARAEISKRAHNK